MNKDFTVPDYIQKLLLSSGQGLDVLTGTLSDLLNRPVIISSSAYKIVSSSSAYDFDFFHAEIDTPRESNESLFFCRISAGAFQAKAVGRAIFPAGRIIGYVFILFDDSWLDATAYKPILDYTASLCAVHLQGRQEHKQKQYRFRNAFLYDLIYGNLKRSEDIIATGEMWGWDFRRPHAVLLFFLPELEIHSSEWHLMDVLTEVVEQAFVSKYYKNSASLSRQNELVVLIPMETGGIAEQKEDLLAFAGKILMQAEGTELAGRIACGTGQPYADATDLFRSYQEAKVALEMGKLLDIVIPFFSDLGLERILYKHDLQDLKEYYLHILGELHKHDDEESSLIHILQSFADNQFDVAKTAKAIFLHPNTLRYRLNKIESLLGRSLADINTRLDIVAALKIRRLHKIDQEL